MHVGAFTFHKALRYTKEEVCVDLFLIHNIPFHIWSLNT